MKYPIKMGGQSKREEQRTKENMIPFTNQFETYLATLKAYKASFIGKCRSRNFLNQKPVTLLWQVFPVYHLPNPYFPIFQTKRNTLHMFYTLTSCPPTHTHTHTHLHFTFYNQEAPVPSPCFLSTDHILSKIPLHPLHFQYFHHHLFLKLMQIFPPPNNVAKLVSSPSFSS